MYKNKEPVLDREQIPESRCCPGHRVESFSNNSMVQLVASVTVSQDCKELSKRIHTSSRSISFSGFPPFALLVEDLKNFAFIE